MATMFVAAKSDFDAAVMEVVKAIGPAEVVCICAAGAIDASTFFCAGVLVANVVKVDLPKENGAVVDFSSGFSESFFFIISASFVACLKACSN